MKTSANAGHASREASLAPWLELSMLQYNKIFSLAEDYVPLIPESYAPLQRAASASRIPYRDAQSTPDDTSVGTEGMYFKRMRVPSTYYCALLLAVSSSFPKRLRKYACACCTKCDVSQWVRRSVDAGSSEVSDSFESASSDLTTDLVVMAPKLSVRIVGQERDGVLLIARDGYDKEVRAGGGCEREGK